MNRCRQWEFVVDSASAIVWRLITSSSHHCGFVELLRIVLGWYNAKVIEALVI